MSPQKTAAQSGGPIYHRIRNSSWIRIYSCIQLYIIILNTALSCELIRRHLDSRIRVTRMVTRAARDGRKEGAVRMGRREVHKNIMTHVTVKTAPP